MEGAKDVKGLAAMFESKSKRVEPVKKAGPAKKLDGEGGVKNMAAMFERKATNKFDQDKKKFLTGNATQNVNPNPFVK